MHGSMDKPVTKPGHMKHLYLRLLLMAVLHFIAMYFLMYAMVDRSENVVLNLNQFYMAAIMTSPMLVIEIVLMWSMYGNKKIIIGVLAGGVAIIIVALLFIRQQTGIGDEQFLRSMIPHHAGAILMCEEASVTDARIQELCEQIKASQQAEIDLMKAILEDIK